MRITIKSAEKTPTLVLPVLLFCNTKKKGSISNSENRSADLHRAPEIAGERPGRGKEEPTKASPQPTLAGAGDRFPFALSFFSPSGGLGLGGMMTSIRPAGAAGLVEVDELYHMKMEYFISPKEGGPTLPIRLYARRPILE